MPLVRTLFLGLLYALIAFNTALGGTEPVWVNETESLQTAYQATGDTPRNDQDDSYPTTSTSRKVLATLFIVFIVGGLFSEMQTPGVGISFAIAVVAAVLFFTLFYMAGLVEWVDIVLFAVGVVLVLIEIFAIPGFGLTGILGLIFTIVGLALALVDNAQILALNSNSIHDMLVAVALVIIGLTVGVFGSMLLSHFLTTSKHTPAMALHKEMTPAEGYIGVQQLSPELVGKEGVAETVLRPSGKVLIEGVSYDAVALGTMIEKGAAVVVQKIESNQLYVRGV